VYITLEQYARAADVSEATASRRLKGLPYRIPTKARGRRWYPLAAAVTTLKYKESHAGAAQALAQGARDLFGHDLYIEPESLPMARSFAAWLPEPDTRDRLEMAQSDFVVTVAHSPLCSPAIVRNITPLRDLYALCPPIMKWTICGGTVPDTDAIAPAFAVASNEAALDQYHTPMKEAA